jgi:hypothetical protein
MMITLMDTMCALPKDHQHSRTKAQCLDHQIRHSTHQDRKQRTKEAGRAIKKKLTNCFNQKAAYKIAKKWYGHMGNRSPKPTRQDLVTTAEGYHQLYCLQEPHGNPIPTNVALAPKDDGISSEEEIDKAVHHL